VSFKPGPEDC